MRNFFFLNIRREYYEKEIIRKKYFLKLKIFFKKLKDKKLEKVKEIFK